ncbi:hypothetical protein DER29_5136 [Micromonospora sp. M71_S20]|uniref:hypothetical protein n=1 Tax=Micromonospora sp. M71_S20 TaxID=592872 RepID=UPI000F2B2C0E|nr:hypothetical protein [Micromonospora sp. M71_S20]RLK11866.1 hypothetical protein DER29_5136 [Micromonospora sp. M71_S20]
MIRIRLDEPTLARTRIAISPLREVWTSLYRRRLLYSLEPAGLALVQLVGDEPVVASGG